MMKFTFREYEHKEIPYELTAKDKDYLFELQKRYVQPFTFHSLSKGTYFKFYSFVGVLELEHARIVIVPKFNRTFLDVVEMMLFAEEMPIPIEHDTKTELAQHSLVELLVKIFVKEVENILRIGVFKEYVTESDNLNLLRGSIEVREHIKVNMFQQGKIYCVYDELETNVIENQVIRTALEIARRFNVSKELMKDVHRLLDEFTMIADVFPYEEWPNFQYTRLNQHYERGHKLAYYIWKQMYMNHMYEFHQRTHFSFLLDMNELFEKFVGQLFVKFLPRAYKVKEQAMFKKAIIRDGESYRVMKPDILIESSEQQTIVIDTKYKPYGKHRVSNADIYQLSFYGHFVADDVPFTAMIIYPRYAKEAASSEVIQLLPGTVHEGRLLVKPISIEQILRAYQQKDIGFLKEMAKDLLI